MSAMPLTALGTSHRGLKPMVCNAKGYTQQRDCTRFSRVSLFIATRRPKKTPRDTAFRIFGRKYKKKTKPTKSVEGFALIEKKRLPKPEP